MKKSILILSIFIAIISVLFVSEINIFNCKNLNCYNKNAICSIDNNSHLVNKNTKINLNNMENKATNNAFYNENEEIIENKNENTVNIYVADNLKNEDYIDVDIPDDNYYFIMSSEKLTDEEIIENVENFNNNIEHLKQEMHQIQGRMFKIQKMFYDMFNW